MVVNAILEDVKIYNVQDRLDVVIGNDVQFETLETLPTDFAIFSDNDPVLAFDSNGWKVNVMSLGVSRIRFMSGTSVIKDILMYAVAATHPAATTLNGVLGAPVPK